MKEQFFDVGLYASLVLLGLGLAWRLTRLLAGRVGLSARGAPPLGKRLGDGLKAGLQTLFSLRIFKFLGAFLIDGLLQWRVLRRDPRAFLKHILIFVGFTGLLLFHALGTYVSSALDPDYQSTLNPFLFLRNLFGLLALAGLLLAVVRRVLPGNVKSPAMDSLLLGLLIAIMVSGFLLEALKIHSYKAFARMADEYGEGAEAEESRALEAYWVTNFGLAATHVEPPFDEDLLATGAAQHESSCALCHSRPRSAFVSASLAALTRPFSAAADRADLADLLWYFHVAACFLALALASFSRLFHVLATPLSTAVASLPADGGSGAAAREVLELQGCSHGGTCHEDCPVRVRRLSRIEAQERFGAVWDEVSQKSGRELGNREARG